MSSLNKAILIGHVGRDAQHTVTEGGRGRLSFTLATNESYKAPTGDWREETDWHNIVLWGEAADRRRDQITRGRQVYVEGRIRTRTYKDREGADRKITEVTARRVLLLGPGNGRSHDPDPVSEDEAPF